MHLIALTAIAVGAAQLICVGLGWRHDSVGVAMLMIGGIFTIFFGIIAYVHGSLLKHGSAPAVRPSTNVLYYSGFPPFMLVFLFVAGFSHLGTVTLYIAELFQLLGLGVLGAWLRALVEESARSV